MQRWIVGGLWAVAGLWACGGGGGGEGKPSLEVQQLGKFCDTAADCASGVCLKVHLRAEDPGTCSLACTVDRECEGGSQTVGFVCGVAKEGERRCLPDCHDSSIGVACVDDVTTSCSAAPDSACERCGCADDAATYCSPGKGCLPLADVGDKCANHGDCVSRHCSPTAHVCRVRVGSPCTAENCDRCLTAPNGFSACSRICSDDNECLCVADAASSFEFTCRPSCNDDCPGPCKNVFGGGPYCPCEGCTVAR